MKHSWAQLALLGVGGLLVLFSVYLLGKSHGADEILLAHTGTAFLEECPADVKETIEWYEDLILWGGITHTNEAVRCDLIPVRDLERYAKFLRAFRDFQLYGPQCSVPKRDPEI